MQLVRAPGLTMTFQPDGRLLVRAPVLARAGTAPPASVAVLSFCGEPRSEEEVAAEFGPPGVALFRGLAAARLLVPPAAAVGVTTMFRNFARVDVHRRMIADQARVDAYRRALAATVPPGGVVLDAGTGSGLLAVLAARAGARRVYAVDRSDLLELATEVVAASGMADRVTLLRGDFGRMALPEPIDVIVTETFGALALAEGAARDLETCAARHLAPHGVLLPGRVTVHLAPVRDEALMDAALGVFARHEGVDLGPLRRRAETEGWTTAVSPDALLHPGLPVASGSTRRERLAGAVRFEELAPGPVHALAGWFTLHLTDDVDLPTGPNDPPTHWQQVLLPLSAVTTDGALDLRLTLAPDPDDRRGVEVTVAGPALPTHRWRVR
jgi:SAM-dependent methyltransferase